MSGCMCWGWLWLLRVSERTRGLLLGRVRVTRFRSLEPPSRLQDSCYDSWHFWPLWWFCDALVVDLLLVPWPGLIHTTAGGPSSGCSWTQADKVWCRSSSKRVVAVKEVTHSRSASTSCLDRFITASKTPTASDGGEVDCSFHPFGVWRKAAHWRQALVTWTMALSISRAYR